MTIHPIHATLVRVDSHQRERFVVLNRLGVGHVVVGHARVVVVDSSDTGSDGAEEVGLEHRPDRGRRPMPAH